MCELKVERHVTCTSIVLFSGLSVFLNRNKSGDTTHVGLL